jgi:uncharacterized membrane protein
VDVEGTAAEPRSTLRTPAASYAAVSYLPQALACRLVGTFSSRPVLQLYGMRLFNLLFYAAMLALALAYAPFGKRVLLSVGALPMAIHQAASASPDAFTHGSALLALALLLRITLRGDYRRRELLAVVALAVATALTKPIYLFLFLVPARALLGPRSRAHAARAAGLVLLSLGAAAAALAARRIAPEALSWPHGQANALQQLSVLSADPAAFLHAVWRTVRADGLFYAESIVGYLGWVDTQLPAALVAIAWAGLLLVAWTDGPYPALPDLRLKGLLVGVALAVLGALFAIGFVAWTPSGADVVHGIQGRYMIPVVPLFLFAWTRRRAATKPWHPVHDAALAAGLAAILTWSLIASAARYYV